MTTDRDQQPRLAARTRESAPDPPGGGSSPRNDADIPSEQALVAAARAADAEESADAARDAAEGEISSEEVREHLRRRAIFLRELAEARELRRRVTPHRSRRARIHAALRRRTFRIN